MIKIFTIKFDRVKEVFFDETINDFILNKKIISLREEFFRIGNIPYWTIFINYEEIIDSKYLKNEKKEKAGLNEWQKILFEKLREWRNDISHKNGIPAYLVATNSELREIVLNSPDSIEKLKLIRGFGIKKIEKYGKDITKIINLFFEKNER